MTTPDFRQMSPEEFSVWQASNHYDPANAPVTAVDVAQSYAAARTLSGLSPVAPGTPKAAEAPTARPANEVWGKDTEFDFVCPSGAMCRLRKLEVLNLLTAGIIDQVSRLPGIAQDLIDKAEIKPPTKTDEEAALSTDETLMLLNMLEIIVPMAVVSPEVRAVPKEGPKTVGVIYLNTIDLGDQVAIMNRSLQGVVDLDPFRAGAGESS